MGRWPIRAWPRGCFCETSRGLHVGAGRMLVIVAILQADVVSTILRSLESKNLEAPSMHPGRAPPACMKPSEEHLIEIDLY
jgi:hypothetical protein